MVPLTERSVPQSATQSINSTVGDFIVSWSLFDQALDLLLVAVMPTAIARGLQDKPPANFKPRMAALTGAFERISELRDLENAVSRIVAVARETFVHRGTLGHGALSHYADKPTPHLVFAKVRWDKGQCSFVQDDIVLTLAKVGAEAQRIRRATTEAHAIVGEILERI